MPYSQKQKPLFGLILLAAFCASVFLQIPKTSASYQTAKATDTIAGYSALLTSAAFPPNTPLEFVVEKPNGGETILLSAVTNAQGIATAELLGYHTKKSGAYLLGARLTTDTSLPPLTSFRVYADVPSSALSSVAVDRELLKSDNADTANLTVTLKDAYGNPVPGRTVDIISSRAEDQVEIFLGNVTDEVGQLLASVKSATPGLSVYMVLDSGSRQILQERAKVVYLEGNIKASFMSAPKNYLLAANVLAATGNVSSSTTTEATTTSSTATTAKTEGVSYFKITDLPTEVVAGKATSATVTAYDTKGNVVMNYLGKVRFGATDTQAKLPEDYTFTIQDQGKHAFSLAFTFKTVGTQTLTVNDLEKLSVKAEKSLSVTNEISTGNLTRPMIESPASGTYKTANLTITGKAPNTANVKILDDDTELGQTEATIDGTFSFEAKNLSDGTHTLFAMSVKPGETAGPISTENLEIAIDTKAPVIERYTVVPGEILAGDLVTITIFSEKDLSKAQIIENGILQNLTNTASGYTVSFKAPDKVDQYPVTIILADAIGNEETFKDKIDLVVKASTAPEKTVGLKATGQGGDGKVFLSWDPSPNPEKIKNFKIYYGLSGSGLDAVTETDGLRKHWEVRNLTNGQKYFFNIAAVGANGQEGERSDIVFATPEAPIHPAALALNEDLPLENTESGPEMWWVALASVVFALVVRRLSGSRHF